MRSFLNLAVATLAFLTASSTAAPIVVQPGDESQLILTAENTLNGTNIPAVILAATPLRVRIINNFSTSSSLKAYVTGKDANGSPVFLSTSGTWYYPNAGGSSTPVLVQGSIGLSVNGYGQTTDFILPDYLSSGRIWFVEGELKFYTLASEGLNKIVEPSFANAQDPSAGVKWGFIELTTNSGGIFANLSFVDFVGLPLGMRLTLASGAVQTFKGLKQGTLVSICNEMKTQAAADGQPWDKMCVTDSAGNALRVLSPNIYVDINPTAMSSYWTNYVNQVWTKYTSADLTIDTQGAAGKVACRVSNNVLTCAGDNRSYAKPSTKDIFGCNSGPFGILGTDNDVHHAVVARLCAAFTRGTLLLTGGNVQPSLGSASYYTTSPNSHYSRIVHKYETDGVGYAFSYDDVNPIGQNQAGVVSGPNPILLEIAIGGLS